MLPYYTAKAVSAHITLITSLPEENLYLVVGEDAAVLIDAGLGVCGLRSFVEGCTDKPLTVLLSHGHVDHASGAAEFERAYLSPSDAALYFRHTQDRERRSYLKASLGSAYARLREADFFPTDPCRKFPGLADGMVFDLGGVHVRSVAFPGHTQGMTVFLVEEDRCLILGDACNNATFLFAPEASSVSAYRDTVESVVLRLEGQYDRVFLSHHLAETSPRILAEMLELCDEVLSGKSDRVPFHFGDMDALIAKKCSSRFVREDGKSANLLYNPRRIL